MGMKSQHKNLFLEDSFRQIPEKQFGTYSCYKISERLFCLFLLINTTLKQTTHLKMLMVFIGELRDENLD